LRVVGDCSRYYPGKKVNHTLGRVFSRKRANSWVQVSCRGNINLNLDKTDEREQRFQAAVDEIDGTLTGKYGHKEVKKSDRTVVYFLAGVGALFIAIGVLCWTIEGHQNRAGTVSTNSPPQVRDAPPGDTQGP
jgi:hypothetical protein